jgi:hypothetical protein
MKANLPEDLSPGSYHLVVLPSGVAFDGANIWVANQGSNNVSKL